ncbi:hypothetical protein WA158_006061 [Blastocystis sp. Blastoise]
MNTSSTDSLYLSKRTKGNSTFQIDPEDPLLNRQRGIKIKDTFDGKQIKSLMSKVPSILVSVLLPDIEINDQTCAFYLPLSKYTMNKKTLLERIDNVKRFYSVILVLCYIDTEKNVFDLRDLSSSLMFTSASLIVTHSKQESAQYIEIYKLYENASPVQIKEKVSENVIEQTHNILKHIKTIDKRNVTEMCNRFTCMADLLKVSYTELEDIPGMGDKKIMNFIKALQHPIKEEY